MIPASFDYYRAHSVQEAIALLQQHGDAKLIAGGHSLIPMMKLRLAEPGALIDIGRIPGLAGISKADGRVEIGALTTHATLAASDVLKEHCPILAEAAGKIADPQVRNKGTIGGNLIHADPGSDLPAIVLALGGALHAAGPRGTRDIDPGDFFVGLLTTALQPNEVLTGIGIPALGSRTGSAYVSFKHPASGYSVCGAAAIVRLSETGTCEKARLCFNGVTATPHDARAVADALAGTNLDDATIDQMVDRHLSIDDASGDIYASGPYRVHLANVYGKRALKLARDRVLARRQMTEA